MNRKIEHQVKQDEPQFPFPIPDYRFDQKNEMFKRRTWDEEIRPHGDRLYKSVKYRDRYGYRKLDYALRNAAWNLEYDFGFGTMRGDMGLYSWTKIADKVKRFVETGNPVKAIIGNYDKQKARREFGIDENDKVILILGGSQGASSINQNILDNIKSVPENYRLLWQTGELNYDEIKSGLDEKQLARCILIPFTNEIEKYYAAADIAIARAGALTMAELEAATLPSILIPYPHAAEDHQRKNAECFVDNNASLSFDDDMLKEYNMPAVAVDLCDRGTRDVMADALLKLKNKKQKPAVEMIVDEILEQVYIEGIVS